ncbi:MAG: Crp/Fnr family transcriptional regulator [Thiogranum sp.]|jgi:hypothetical protein|nr:Crp/Fnr family transcriptional regulator [Thiogranum sp.]
MTPDQKHALIELLDKLPASDLAALTRFAEFLLHQSPASPLHLSGDAAAPAPAEIPEPEAIPRPGEERVVAAVKRLSRTYYMLDKKKMLGVTSDLVTQHLLQGRDSSDVIDELEAIFEQQYRELRGDRG